MRKTLLVAAFAAMAAAGYAQNHQFYDLSTIIWTDADDFDNPTYGVLQKVSANGKYAVGYDSQMETNAVYLWCKDDPNNLSFDNAPINNRRSAYDVTNDGMIVGGVEFRDPDFPDFEAVSYPGYKVWGGEWNKLPVPENFSEYYATSDPIEEGRAVTPDGKYIAGHLHCIVGYKTTMFGDTEVSHITPCLWTRNEQGTYDLTTVFSQLYKNPMIYKDGAFVESGKDSVYFREFIVWDISNDGKVIAGFSESGSGGFNPAIIRDGRMLQIFDCGDEGDEDRNFNGGIANSIDANGNVYGYYQLADSSAKFFCLTNKDELVYLDDFIVCADKNGTKYPQSFGSLSHALDCSEDGSVVVGGVSVSTGYGVVNGPAVMYNPDGAGICRPDAASQQVSIDWREGGMMFVNGIYTSAEVYDIQGRLVDNGVQGKAFNLSGSPRGVYLVKVNTVNGSQTFKVRR